MFDLLRRDLRALAFPVPRGVRVPWLAARSMTCVDILLVVLSPVHHNGLRLRWTTRKIPLLDVSNSAAKLMVVLYVLIRNLGSLRQIRLVWWLNLTWVDGGRGHSVVQDVLSSASLHMNCGWVAAGGNFDLRIVNYEIINIIVRNDVGYHLLILLAC